MAIRVGETDFGVEAVATAFHVPLPQLCICSHRSHHRSSFLALYSCTVGRAWSVGIHAGSGDSTDHKHRPQLQNYRSRQGPQRQPGPLMLIWPLGTAQHRDITMASGGSTGHSHQPGPQHSTRTAQFFLLSHLHHVSVHHSAGGGGGPGFCPD